MIKENYDMSSLLMSDFLSIYAKTEKSLGYNNDFSIEISEFKTFKLFKECFPDYQYFNNEETLTIKNNFDIWSNVAFKYLIEKILLEYSYNVVTSLEEAFNNYRLDNGVLTFITEDYIKWIDNNCGIYLGLNNVNIIEFSYKLKESNFLDYVIIELNKLLYKFPNKIAYPIKWEEYTDNENKRLYIALMDLNSEFYHKYNLLNLSNIDFRLIHEGRLLK